MLGGTDQVVLITAVARSHTVYKYASAEDGATLETTHTVMVRPLDPHQPV